jgi:hypothetical protein
VPINDISYPSGATHISLKGAYANVDFTNEISAIEYSPVTNLPIDGTNTPVTLTPCRCSCWYWYKVLPVAD